jgi:hypothetical protein
MPCGTTSAEQARRVLQIECGCLGCGVVGTQVSLQPLLQTKKKKTSPEYYNGTVWNSGNTQYLASWEEEGWSNVLNREANILGRVTR